MEIRWGWIVALGAVGFEVMDGVDSERMRFWDLLLLFASSIVAFLVQGKATWLASCGCNVIANKIPTRVIDSMSSTLHRPHLLFESFTISRFRPLFLTWHESQCPIILSSASPNSKPVEL